MTGAIAAIFVVAATLAQTPAETYAWPLDLPRELTSSFAEYRPGRFHMGIDLRTGPIGKDVYAAADGYVSRLRCSPYGYGKAAYVQFDDGNSAVYAHLDDFAPALRDYVRAAQHTREEYTVDLNVPRDKFRVKRGELIAKSGQTGIGVPHLHYELRDPAGVPINPRLLGVTWPDSAPPEILAVALIPLRTPLASVGGNTGPVVLPAKKISPGRYEIAESRVRGPLALAVDAHDPAGGSKLGVYRVTARDANGEFFRFETDRVSYDETEDGAISFYPPLTEKGKFLTLWRWPGVESTNYSVRGSGMFDFEDDGPTELVIAVEDFHGNTSTVTIPVRGDSTPLPGEPPRDPSGNVLLPPPRAKANGSLSYECTGAALVVTARFDRDEPVLPVLATAEGKVAFEFQRVNARTFSVSYHPAALVSDLQLRVMHPGIDAAPQRFVFLKRGAPAQTLSFDDATLRTQPNSPYGNLELSVTKVDPDATPGLTSHGAAYEIFPAYMPVDAPITISLPMPPGVSEITRAHVYRREKDKWTRFNTKRPAGRAEAEAKQLGVYAVLEDLTPPTLELLQPSAVVALRSARPVIRARAIDLGSGIDTFSATYNGEWILLAYDPEQDLLEWEQDEDLPPGPGTLVVEVRDYAGNVSRREMNLTIPIP